MKNNLFIHKLQYLHGLHCLKPVGVICVICAICGPIIAAYGPFSNSFNAGECSDNVMYRIDLAQYGAACRVLENMTVALQGTAVRRPGTQYIAGMGDGTDSRLLSYERSTDKAIVIEVTDDKIYFFTDGGQIQQ